MVVAFCKSNIKQRNSQLIVSYLFAVNWHTTYIKAPKH